MDTHTALPDTLELGSPLEAQPMLSVGRTWHLRVRPVRRSFAYPVLFVWLPMRSLRAQASEVLARNRFGLLSFHDRDHGVGRDDALSWLEQLLAAEGIEADGEIWLQTLPRVLGYAFKPVSFWYVQRRSGELVCVVAEVNNTFGERHCYLLPVPPHPPNAPLPTASAYHFKAAASKVFHVSPFCDVAGEYAFEFAARGPWRVARVNLSDAQGPLLRTSLSGHLQPLTRAAVWRTVARMPWAALMVMWRIHWQALHLWRGRVPFFRQPDLPDQFVTRSH